MSKFNFLNLDEETRLLMLEEIQLDNSEDKLFISERLNEEGKEVYLDFLIDSVKNEDENYLQNLLDNYDYFEKTELRNGKPVKVPNNASKLLSQSEFNRFYIRAICLKAIKHNFENVEVYRARESSWSREGSEDKIGSLISAKNLLT